MTSTAKLPARSVYVCSSKAFYDDLIDHAGADALNRLFPGATEALICLDLGGGHVVGRIVRWFSEDDS